MAIWIKSDTKQQIDVSQGQGITENGTYFLLRSRYSTRSPALFGARVKAPGHTAAVQLFAECAGASLTIGAPLVPTNGSPVMLTDEITLTGNRGIVVSGITGVVYPEVTQ